MFVEKVMGQAKERVKASGAQALRFTLAAGITAFLATGPAVAQHQGGEQKQKQGEVKGAQASNPTPSPALNSFNARHGSATHQGYVSEVDSRRTNIELIKARVEEARAQAELAEAQYKLIADVKKAEEERSSPRGGPSLDAPSLGAAPAHESPQPNQSGVNIESVPILPAIQIEPTPPGVVAIFGSDENVYATLQMPDGSLIDVKKGDEIDGGFTVKEVTPKRVVASRKSGKKTKDYTLKSAAAIQAQRLQGAPQNLLLQSPQMGMNAGGFPGQGFAPGPQIQNRW